jgi:hypothetical protein
VQHSVANHVGSVVNQGANACRVTAVCRQNACTDYCKALLLYDLLIVDVTGR